MNPRCPYYISPRLFVYNGELEEDSAMCKLLNEVCLLMRGFECDIYEEYLRKNETCRIQKNTKRRRYENSFN